MSDLSPQLKTEVFKWNKRELLSKTPLFSDAVEEGDVERSMVSAVVSHLEAQVVFSNDVVLQEGDAAIGVFFIHSGLVELRVSFLKTRNWVSRRVSESMGSNNGVYSDPVTTQYGGVFGAIGSGSYFGDVSVLLETAVTATVRSVSTTVLYQLQKRRLIEILAQMPKTEAYMRQIAEARYSRMKLRSPHTPHEEWKMLSKRPNLMVDAEDSRTTLFLMEHDAVKKVRKRQPSWQRLLAVAATSSRQQL